MIISISAFSSLATGCSLSDASSLDKEIENVNVGTSTVSSENDESSKSEETDSKNEDIVSNDEDAASKPDESSNLTNKSVTITETVIVDQDGVVITAKDMGESIWGSEINVLIENNTDKNLTFQVGNASVNGFMADTMFSADVAAGKKSNAEITFSTEGLKAFGIDTFANIELSFHIFTSDDWEDYLDTAPIVIETSAAADYKQEIDDSGKPFYDNNGIKIIGKSLSTSDSVFGPGLILYIENNSNQNITVQASDTSVNGFMVDTSMSEDVLVGKKSITALTFMSSSLEENGITDIKTVETSFHVFDAESWDTIIDTDPITIEFE